MIYSNLSNLPKVKNMFPTPYVYKFSKNTTEIDFSKRNAKTSFSMTKIRLSMVFEICHA